MKRRVVIRRVKPRAKPSQESSLSWQNIVSASGFLFGIGLLGSVLWLWRAGWFQAQTEHVVAAFLEITRHAGFAVEDVLVEGRGQTDKDMILDVLKVEKGSSILAFDPHEALQRLETISWVKDGVVERRLPNIIFVHLFEREPIAIWQMNKSFKLIDRDGHVLRELGKDETLSLPHVVGEGANTQAADLISQLLVYPAIISSTKAAVRVSDRRWNLFMQQGIVIKLPEENTSVALERLNRLVTEQNILERNIQGLDLRLPDRMAVETPEPIEKPKNGKKGI
jgi:cell division protein FtsQ